jgi:hypothetical protein
VIQGNTFFIQDSGGDGWTETLFSQGPTANLDLSFSSAYMQARGRMLTNNFAIVGARLWDPANPRSTYTNLVNSGTGAYPTAGVTPMPSDVAILILLTGDTSHKSHMFLRGLNSDCISGQSVVNLGTWFAKLNDWISLLTTANWSGGGTASRGYVRTGRGKVGGPTYTAIALVNLIRVSNRRVGRPFGHSPGRRIAR